MNNAVFGLILLSFSASSFALGDRGMAKKIAADLGADEEEVFQIIKSFKREVITTLREGKIVRMQGLGQFYFEEQAARDGNPRTGETKASPAKKYLRFKPSKVGNQSLNAEE